MRKRSFLAAQNIFFPEEILIEILSYVEAKYLLRCKSVCKLWCALIRSKPLVELHLIRNGHRYYDMRTIGKSLSSDGIVVKIDYLCYQCRGLVLLGFSAASSSANFRVYNATTNFSIDLPRPHKSVSSIHVFLNICTGSYNVLSIYLDDEKKTRHLELLDLGGQSNDPCPNKDLSWRTLNIAEYENVSTHETYNSRYCMSTEGSILYILSSPYVGSTKLKITCVDIAALTCTTLDMPVTLSLSWARTLDMPVTLSLSWARIRFQLWRGKPSVVYILEDKLYILALKDYKTHKWADTMVFPLPFLKKPSKLSVFLPLIYTDGTEDILLCSKERFSPRCSVYKLESKVSCHIPHLPWKVAATLVSVKGMQPQKKEPQIKLYA